MMNNQQVKHTAVAVLMVVAMIFAGGCSEKKSVRTIDPQKVNFEVTYDANFDGIIYPSLIMGLANYNGKVESDFFSYRVTSPKDNSVLRIVMDSSVLNYITFFQANLPNKGETYTFYDGILSFNGKQVFEVIKLTETELTLKRLDISLIKQEYIDMNRITPDGKE